jgi:hypothetical protein
LYRGRSADVASLDSEGLTAASTADKIAKS